MRERERKRERGREAERETDIKEGRREEGRQRVKNKGNKWTQAELSVQVQALTYLFRVILYIVCGLCCECGVMVVGGAFSRSKR